MDSDTSDEWRPEKICPISECDEPIDVIIVSSDGVEFGAHRKNLALFSAGLPNFLSEPSSEANPPFPIERVKFEEKTEPLRLLLQYMHHTNQPDLSNVSIGLLYDLAEAAEKYGVYSALPVCQTRMELSLATCPRGRTPLLVLFYAVRHGHDALADKAAYAALEHCSVETFLKEAYQADIHRSAIIKWLRYREMHRSTADKVQNFLDSYEFDSGQYEHMRKCENWQKIEHKVFRMIADNFMLATDFRAVLPWDLGQSCEGCAGLMEEWVDDMQKNASWAGTMKMPEEGRIRYSTLDEHG